MAIRVDYSPVAGALNLAQSAGADQGTLARQARDLQLLQFGLQQQQVLGQQYAQQQAFDLQRAAQDRMSRTPTAQRQAQYFPSQSELFAQTPQAAQIAQMEVQKQGLQKMLEAGQIDPPTYEANLLRLQGGQALQFPQKQEDTVPTSIRTAPFTTRIQALQKERELAAQWAAAPDLDPAVTAKYQGRMAQIDQQIAQIVDEAQKSFGKGPVDPLRREEGDMTNLGEMLSSDPGRSFEATVPFSQGRSTAASAAVTGQRITPAQANQILQESGWDVTKAKARARELGYTF